MKPEQNITVSVCCVHSSPHFIFQFGNVCGMLYFYYDIYTMATSLSTCSQHCNKVELIHSTGLWQCCCATFGNWEVMFWQLFLC